jgi:hypothetical protein
MFASLSIIRHICYHFSIIDLAGDLKDMLPDSSGFRIFIEDGGYGIRNPDGSAGVPPVYEPVQGRGPFRLWDNGTGQDSGG